MHRSVATLDSPQFLNLQPLDINPLMSKCEIKLFYVGANRNKSFITEQVATEMGKRLRGAPIVGYYKKEKEDFRDHGEKVIIDDEGIRFQCQTFPYGFVSPDAQVWFQNFEDFDEMGNSVIHKYLMTTGYLWTSQFPESSLPVNEGRPQSMELNDESVRGKWETNYANNVDYFIIDDAIIEKVCILGEDVEPCFEGASVTAPDVSLNFSMDDKFKHTLYSMMQDLKDALKGGKQQMDNLENATSVEQTEEVTTTFELEEKTAEIEVTDNSDDASTLETEFAKEDDDKDKKDDSSEEETSDSDSKDNEDNDDDDEEDDDKKKDKYQLMEEELKSIKQSYSLLQAQCQELMEFKKEIDNKEKDSLIAEFYMLSEDDLKDVKENKEKYTLEEIKSKLAVICFDKKINFTANNESEQVSHEEDIMTYNLENDKNDSLPEWVKAVKQQEKFM